ncbi:hypothetical protein ACOSQ2_026682 [Xanthoceras sorbifolium]|uniref:Small ribosomal subunit protein uS11c n=1 Tax=Xanthoceras sorbifolium TaxID=99658 RepID=A0ABQ8HEM9_9ROSI|nr:hypothetical protein JRO89_XS11G0036800 [Xanthoceras sorbifolium]
MALLLHSFTSALTSATNLFSNININDNNTTTPSLSRFRVPRQHRIKCNVVEPLKYENKSPFISTLGNDLSASKSHLDFTINEHDTKLRVFSGIATPAISQLGTHRAVTIAKAAAKSVSGRGSRRTGRTGSRKNARRIPKGIIHVQASFNNTIVTVTDVQGQVISWSSAGCCGFKGTRRGTPFAAQNAATNAIRAATDQGMQRAEVMIKGAGLGRDAALRSIRRSGILLSFVRDVTPMPHNGCRPPKKRRV